jgi:hypothetical protein
MAHNCDFTTTGKLLECDGADAVPVPAAHVVSAKINDAIVADVDAVMREARASRHQVIAVTELALSCHAGRSVERRMDPEPRP